MYRLRLQVGRRGGRNFFRVQSLRYIQILPIDIEQAGRGQWNIVQNFAAVRRVYSVRDENIFVPLKNPFPISWEWMNVLMDTPPARFIATRYSIHQSRKWLERMYRRNSSGIELERLSSFCAFPVYYELFPAIRSTRTRTLLSFRGLNRFRSLSIYLLSVIQILSRNARSRKLDKLARKKISVCGSLLVVFERVFKRGVYGLQ